MASSIVTPSPFRSRTASQDLADELGVERAGDLVEQHRPRPLREGASDRDPLLLAAGEVVGAVILRAAPSPKRASIVRARSSASLRATPWARGHAEDDVLDHAQVREQVVGLEDEARGVRRTATASTHGSVITSPSRKTSPSSISIEQVDAAQQGRLAGSRGADQRDRLVLGDLEVDPVQDLALAECLGDPAISSTGSLTSGRSPLAPRSQRSSSRASGIVMHEVEQRGGDQRRVVEGRRTVSIWAVRKASPATPMIGDQGDVLLQRDEVVEQRRSDVAHAPAG